MATNWIVPSTGDVTTVLTTLLTGASPANVQTETNSRLPAALAMVVNRITGVIATQNRSVSATVGTVPPEAQQHAAYLTAMIVAAAMPAVYTVLTQQPGGGKSLFIMMWEKAEKWLEDVSKGMAVTAPTDPVVDANNIPVASPLNWGDYLFSAYEYETGVDGNGLPAVPLDLTTD